MKQQQHQKYLRINQYNIHTYCTTKLGQLKVNVLTTVLRGHTPQFRTQRRTYLFTNFGVFNDQVLCKILQ